MVILSAASTQTVAGSIVLPDATANLLAAALPDLFPAPCTVNCTDETYDGPLLSVIGVSQTYDAGIAPLGPYSAGYATATAFSQPAPAVSVTSSGDAIASVKLDYYFYVNGPVNISVPITLTGSESVSECVQFGGVPDQFLQVTDVSAGLLWFAASLPCGSNCTSSFAFSFGVTSDVEYQVEIFDQVGGIGHVSGGSGPTSYPPSSASIDPIISIDPTFGDANQFQLDLSANVGNSTASIPEPSSLVLIGAALFAFRVRRCRRRPPGFR